MAFKGNYKFQSSKFIVFIKVQIVYRFLILIEMAKNMQMELIGLGLEMKNAQIPNNFGNQSLPNLKI